MLAIARLLRSLARARLSPEVLLPMIEAASGGGEVDADDKQVTAGVLNWPVQCESDWADLIYR